MALAQAKWRRSRAVFDIEITIIAGVVTSRPVERDFAMSRTQSRQLTEEMPPQVAIGRGGARHTARRRLLRAMMEACVVLSLTFATVAVLCLFGLQRASALEAVPVAGSEGRLAIGGVLLAGFVALCGLTSFMLRNTLQPARRSEPVRRRQG